MPREGLQRVQKGASLTGEGGGCGERHMAGSKWELRAGWRGRLPPPTPVPAPREGLRRDPRAIAGVESSLRVAYCRQILQGLPEHNRAVLGYLVGFLHEVSGRSRVPGAGAPTSVPTQARV